MSKDIYSNYWEKAGSKKNFSTPVQEDLFCNHVTFENSILDIGCGYGRVLTRLSEMGFKNLSGVEPSETLIARAKSENPALSISKIENNKLPFEDESFDCVMLVAVLTCVLDDELRYELLSEAKRVLKSGGKIYINDFMLNTDERNIVRYNKFAKKYGNYGCFELADGGLARHYSDDEVSKMIAGYEKNVFEKIVYTTMNGNKSNGFYYIGTK